MVDEVLQHLPERRRRRLAAEHREREHAGDAGLAHIGHERTQLRLVDEPGGAHRPLKGASKKGAIRPEEAVLEGKTYEVMIEDQGKRGDGIARRDRYTIFVKGAQKGQIYNVKIEKVTGTLAFAGIVSTGNTPGAGQSGQK